MRHNITRRTAVGGILAASVSPALPWTHGVAAPLRQFATRTWVPTAFNPAFHQFQTRTGHFARAGITSLQVVLSLFYVSATGVETNFGANSTYAVGIEYPSGTFTQVKFSGSAIGTGVDGSGFLISDDTAISIPANTQFWVRVWFSNAAGIPYSAPGRIRSALCGDFFHYGASGIADQTMGGTITNTDTNIVVPAALVSRSSTKSVYIIGDSRAVGWKDTINDSTGDIGEFCRSIGPILPYINPSVVGDKAIWWVASNTNRLFLASYCTDFVVELGINDCGTGGQTFATIQTNIQAILSALPSGPKFLSTFPPITTSTDGWITLANQTIASSNILRVPWNTAVRAGTVAVVNGFFEIANVVESSQDSGLWNCPIAGGGTASAVLTADGVHENQTACVLIVTNGAVNPTVFT